MALALLAAPCALPLRTSQLACSSRGGDHTQGPSGLRPAVPAGGSGDADLAISSAEDEADRTRLIALVELARSGDKDAFGLLYDHDQPRSTASSTTGAVGDAGRGPDQRDVLPGAAQHRQLPLAGPRLRRLADHDRAQPHHRPLQGRPHPAGDASEEWAATTTTRARRRRPRLADQRGRWRPSRSCRPSSASA